MSKRRLEVLAALAAGCAAGWLMSTAAGCGTARADEGEAQIVTVKCVNGYAVYEAPGRSASDLLLSVKPVRAVKVDSSAPASVAGSAGHVTDDVPATWLTYVDGAVVYACVQRVGEPTPPTTVTIAVR
jgi:hypothetical protein